MTQFVRVRMENGHEKSVPVAVQQRYSLPIVDKPAHARDGSVKAPKPRRPLGTAAPKTRTPKKAAASANHPRPEVPASDAPKEG